MNDAEVAQALADYEEWVKRICPNDLGDGDHRWGWWPWDEKGRATLDPQDLAWSHRCTNHGGRTSLVVARLDISSGNYHRIVTQDPLHIEASILCPACGDHGFIREGQWQAA